MRRYCLAILLILLSLQAGADETTKPTHNLISLSAQASREVSNDTLVAVLYVQREGNNAAKLADEVNSEISWAVDTAKSSSDIKVQTLNYSTSPIYRKNVLSGWRVSQSIQLESKNSMVLSELLGQLQSRASVQSINYRISDERRRQAEQGLIQEAIANFTERAKLIAKSFNRSGYELVQLSVNTSSNAPRPFMARSMAMESDMAAPRLEAGEQTISVSVNGSVELTRD